MSHDCLELDQILIEEYEAMYGSLPEAMAAPQTKPGPQQNLDAKEGAGPTDPERIKSAKLARVIKRLRHLGATVIEAPPALLGEACVRAYLQLKSRARL